MAGLKRHELAGRGGSLSFLPLLSPAARLELPLLDPQ